MSRRIMMCPEARRPTADDVKVDLCLSVVTAAIPKNCCTLYLRRDKVLALPITYEVEYTSSFVDFCAYIEQNSAATLHSARKSPVVLAAGTDYSVVFTATMPFNADAANVTMYMYSQMPNHGTAIIDEICNDEERLAGTAIKAYCDGKLIWQDVAVSGFEAINGSYETIKLNLQG